MATRRSADVRLLFSRITAGLTVTIIILASQTAANPSVERLDGLKKDSLPNGPLGSRFSRSASTSAGPTDASPILAGPPGLPGLKGDKGDPGRDGFPGLTGIDGFPGIPGRPGIPGLSGPKGAKGAIGISFEGPKGEKGDIGPQGRPGPPGYTYMELEGQTGDERATRRCELKGEIGHPGLPGLRGEKGPMGPEGRPGLDGKTGLPGPPGEPGAHYEGACLAVLLNTDGDNQDPRLFGNGTSLVNREECIAKAYELVKASFQKSVARDGQKSSPARTCKHLFLAYPDKPSGEYWIDPNDEDISDAILVKCNAEKRSTCITPTTSRSPNISYVTDGSVWPAVWLSEIEEGIQITYRAENNQISFLQLLSNRAEQNITYHCKNTTGYYDKDGQTYEKGLKLSAWNDVELTARGNQHLGMGYNVTLDECQDRLAEWKKTVITYDTDKPVRLPILDVGVKDIGKPEQSFSVEIGEVCFT